jgi:hypothetical protein
MSFVRLHFTQNHSPHYIYSLLLSLLLGLAVDRENGWICHLSYTHKVAVAWEGRNRVSRSRLVAEYSGKRALSPSQRRLRLKPLNDLFSMAECCLMADTVVSATASCTLYDDE